MIRCLLLAVALLTALPLTAQAETFTLLPAIKLQIGDQDDRGRYWDGGSWRDRDYWHRHYYWRDHHWHPHDRGWHRGWDKPDHWGHGPHGDKHGHGHGHGGGHHH